MAMSFKQIILLELLKEDFIIVVMGLSGSGKSNFIQKLLSGRPKPQGLKSTTAEIKAFRIFNPPVGAPISSLVVVDMPGFDDTNKTDYEILNMTAEGLRQSYSDGFPVAGLLYCHRITDNRVSGVSNRNLRMFSKLTGSEALGKVTLLQTMWDVVRPESGKARDKELRETFWKLLIGGGAKIEQFRSTPDEAWSIVNRCVKLHAEYGVGDPVLLQEEMVHARKKVGESSAGKELYNDYQRLLDQQRQRLRDLQAKDMTHETRARIEKEIQDLDAKLNKTFQEIRKLKINFFRKLILMFKGSSKAQPIVIPVHE